jgi:hypothetical protein
MAEPQTLDLLGGQIDVDQVAGALSAIIPQQQAEALPAAEAEPVQMASAEMPVEPASVEPAVAEEPAAVEPAPVEPAPVAPTAVPQVKIFEYEGQRFKLPADVTQEELDQIIAKYESTPAYAAKKAQTDKSWERENIDSESGAPALVSMVVGPRGELSMTNGWQHFETIILMQCHTVKTISCFLIQILANLHCTTRPV